MENATTALYIAAGTLLGVMILSVVVFFFRRVGTMYDEQDRVMTAQQLAEWNNEYLAYDKKIMYGTDLISVLNKAYSNNEKYIKGNGFLSGDTYTEDYLVNIEFTLNSPLQDIITVTYIDEIGESGRIRGREYNYPVNINVGTEISGPIERDTPITYSADLINTFDDQYSLEQYKASNSINNNINEYTKLITGSYDSIFENSATYSLLDSENKVNQNVDKLMKLSNNLTMTVTNKGEPKGIRIKIQTNGVQTKEYGWYKAIWKTCLSDLKSRKFKCTNIDYDTSKENTGRIKKMSFSEL